MGEPPRITTPLASSPGGYDAFISYSHAVDAQLAPALQRGLHRFAKPLFKIRALNVFRDATDLAANPGLWSAIEAALTRARYFILLASPRAAASEWVGKEVDFWCRHKPVANLLIVLTEGEIVWNAEAADFDWSRTTALPDRLKGVFAEEPRWTDVRFARTATDISLRSSTFREAIADLAATIHGRPKNELIGEDVRQHRRTRRLAGFAVAGMVALTVASVLFAYQAEMQRRAAERERNIALSRLLAVQAEQSRHQDDSLLIRSMLVAIESLKRFPSDSAAETVRAGLAVLGRPVAQFDFASHPDRPSLDADGGFQATVIKPFPGRDAPFAASVGGGEDWAVAVRHQGRTIATVGPFAGWQERYRCAGQPTGVDVDMPFAGRVLRVTDRTTGATGLLMHDGAITGCAFGADGRRIVTASGPIARELPPYPIPGDGILRVWEMPPSIFALSQGRGENRVEATAFSDDGRYLAFAIARDRHPVIRVLDVDSGAIVAQLAPHDGVQAIKHLAFSADGRRLASAPVYADYFQVWSVDEFREVASLKQYSGVGSARFSRDGRYLVTSDLGDASAAAAVWDLDTRTRSHGFGAGDGGRVGVSADGRRLIRATDTDIEVWSLETGKRLSAIALASARHARFLLNATGRLVAVTDDDGTTVRVLDTETGTVRQVLKHDGADIAPLRFSADDRFLVTAAGDVAAAFLWDLGTGRQVRAFRHAATGTTDFNPTFSAAAFSGDGRFLAIASSTYGGVDLGAFQDANVLMVLDLDTGSPVATLRHQGLIEDVTFSPDGRFIAANVWASEESGVAPAYVWMWDHHDLVAAACARLPRNLTRDEWTAVMGDQPYRRTCDRLPAHPSAR